MLKDKAMVQCRMRRRIRRVDLELMSSLGDSDLTSGVPGVYQTNHVYGGSSRSEGLKGGGGGGGGGAFEDIFMPNIASCI